MIHIARPLRRAAMALTPVLLLAAPLAAQAAVPGSASENVVPVSADDAAMNAAIAEAQRTLPEFLQVLAAPPPGVRDISFKFPLEGWEHIWVSNVSRRGNMLVGELNNEPLAKGYRLGQRVEVPFAQVSDWAYRGTDGVIRGHRTTRALLPQLPPEQVAQIKQWTGWE